MCVTVILIRSSQHQVRYSALQNSRIRGWLRAACVAGATSNHRILQHIVDGMCTLYFYHIQEIVSRRHSKCRAQWFEKHGFEKWHCMHGAGAGECAACRLGLVMRVAQCSNLAYYIKMSKYFMIYACVMGIKMISRATRTQIHGKILSFIWKILAGNSKLSILDSFTV